jgi:adenosylcobinamide-GDP ribazoletransferase
VKSLLLAFQFLTRFPIPITIEPTPQVVGRSLLFYPLVGIAIGVGVWGMSHLLHDHSGMLPAALCLLFWVWATGALHIDGLADSADAWVGGMGDRERTLTIMKDPACGPMGVAAIVLLLIVKLALIEEILNSEYVLALILTPMLSRAAVVLLLLTTPYVRAGGMGEGTANHAPRRAAYSVVLISVGVWVTILGVSGIESIIFLSILFWGWRNRLLQRLGGTTGDTAGALIEISELVLLLGLFV